MRVSRFTTAMRTALAGASLLAAPAHADQCAWNANDVAERGREVKHVYVKAARRRFKLTEDDGVRDAEFFG